MLGIIVWTVLCIIGVLVLTFRGHVPSLRLGVQLVVVLVAVPLCWAEMLWDWLHTIPDPIGVVVVLAVVAWLHQDKWLRPRARQP